MATANYITTARASAALPAAGAYDASPVTIPDNQGAEVTFYFDYTRGGAAGAFQYKIENSIDGVNWYQQASVQELPIVAGTDLVAVSQRASISYTATGASKESFSSETLTVASTYIRILAKETGNVGSPGTLAITVFVRIDY